jgi:hypothetical protein
VKILFSIVLAAILLYTGMGKTGIVISYQINKTYIAQELCENKEIPMMQCNGKCQLKAQLQKQESQNEQSSFSTENLPEIFWTASAESDKVLTPSSFTTLYFAFATSELRSYAFAVFQPPRLV